MMDDEKAVRVGDLVYPWEIKESKYNECEFKKTQVPGMFEITKVPDPKPEVTDEPMTRGSVVTIEGDDEFIAVRFVGDEDLAYTFAASYSVLGASGLLGWGEIVSRAEGRKIIVRKMVDPNEEPVKVDTYEEWVAIPEDERKKYKWRDVDGDAWRYYTSLDSFVSEGEDYAMIFDIEHYFPLIRGEKIG